nr:MAG TPA: zinc ribbon domain protein [Caudoviricetes sp.]DAQ75976.1 MAG TPA: zinc ribbon domain protein [Bacteriophage sp.]
MKIDDDDPELDYCDECGSTSVLVTNIDKWRELYKEKYGKHLI